jgi:hypothetical protein
MHMPVRFKGGKGSQVQPGRSRHVVLTLAIMHEVGNWCVCVCERERGRLLTAAEMHRAVSIMAHVPPSQVKKTCVFVCVCVYVEVSACMCACVFIYGRTLSHTRLVFTGSNCMQKPTAGMGTGVGGMTGPHLETLRTKITAPPTR